MAVDGETLDDILRPRYPLNERSAYFSRVLDVVPLTFGRARLTISPDAEADWYLDGF